MKSTPAGGRPPNVIILGALSAIAEAAAREWATQGARLMLVGRDAERLEAVAADLRVRGGFPEHVVADLAAVDAQESFRRMAEHMGHVDVVLLAYGVLGDQKLAEADWAEAHRILESNFTSAAGWCLAAASVLEKQGRGVLIVIGSVAGDRGRASNYVYGASKGGLGLLVQGIAHRLAGTGAAAVLIKPGFVDTPMTASIAKKGLLWAHPKKMGRIIVRASRRRRKNAVVYYAPGFWRWIMYVVRSMPSVLFHRTRL